MFFRIIVTWNRKIEAMSNFAFFKISVAFEWIQRKATAEPARFRPLYSSIFNPYLSQYPSWR